jgi:hypothetical protein
MGSIGGGEDGLWLKKLSGERPQLAGSKWETVPDGTWHFMIASILLHTSFFSHRILISTTY